LFVPLGFVLLTLLLQSFLLSGLGASLLLFFVFLHLEAVGFLSGLQLLVFSAGLTQLGCMLILFSL
jgi:hypothetical protein